MKTQFINIKIPAIALSIFSIVLICLTAPLAVKITFAHEGHDAALPKKTGAANTETDQVGLGKESQFLLGIRTALSIDTPFSNVLNLMGRVIPTTEGASEIVAPQTAKVVSIHAKVGEKVKKGQLLAVLEQNLSTTDQITIATERNRINAELADAKADYERLLKIKDIVAKKDLQEAEIRYRAAQDAKRILDANSGLVRITSPINGYVDNFTLSTGSQLEAGQQIFRVINLDKVWVEAQVFGQDINAINSNTNFIVKSSATGFVTDKVRFISISKALDPGNQSLQLIVEVENPGEVLKVGQFAEVISTGSGLMNTVVVSNSAITDINGKPVIFTKAAPEIFRMHEVQTGQSNGTKTAILKGLNPNERVVVAGTYQLKSIYLNQ